MENAAIRRDEEARLRRAREEDEQHERERAAQRAERERADHARAAEERRATRSRIEADLYRQGLSAVEEKRAADR